MKLDLTQCNIPIREFVQFFADRGYSLTIVPEGQYEMKVTKGSYPFYRYPRQTDFHGWRCRDPLW